MNLIKSSMHEIHSIEINKLTLSINDDKQFFIDDINSRALGHF